MALRSLRVGDQRSLFAYDTAAARTTQTRQQWSEDENAWLDRTRKTTFGTLFEQEHHWTPATDDAATENQPTGASGSGSWSLATTRIHIATPAGIVGTWTQSVDSATPAVAYLHYDHLGSVIAESGGDPADPATYGKILRQFSYDAWGQARDPADWDGPPADAPQRAATDRGYTGHQMLDALGLIHMNGRIYDPHLGRFLSPDPLIQSPGNLQSYNRYSYVLNNPLSYTDPSGFFLKKIFKKIKRFVKKYWKPIVAIALGALTAGLAVWALTPGITGLGGAFAAIAAGKVGFAVGVAAGALGGAVAGGITGGARGALYGALSGAAFGAIGGLDISHWAKVAAHGVTGGLLNEAQGGKFGAGFASAATVQFAAPYVGNMKYAYQRVTTAAVVGGTASELAGGSFENGAVTAAFSRLFNDEMHREALQRQQGMDWGNLSAWQKIKLYGSAAIDGSVDGVQVLADAFNPFGNPYAEAGAYDVNDPYIKASQVSANVASVTAPSSAGLKAFKWFKSGKEFVFRGGKLRVAPFGNRTGHVTGKYPHYHRSVPHPNARRALRGESAPGQSINRHRPWDTKEVDKSFLDRF